MPHTAETRRIEMSWITIRTRPVDVEQHQLRLGVFSTPVTLGQLEEALVVEAVVQLRVQHRAIVGEIAPEGRREEEVQRRGEAFRKDSAHGRHQFVCRREVLGDDQFPRSLGAHHIEQTLTLVFGVDVVDLAGRCGRPEHVRKLDPPLVGEHQLSPYPSSGFV